MSKKWVFIELVQDEKDIIGLISYAIYKYRKNEMAISERSNGKSEEEIQASIQKYNDMVVASQSTQTDFRDKAVSILNVAISKSSAVIMERQQQLIDEKLDNIKNLQASLAQQKINIDKDHQEKMKKELEKIAKEKQTVIKKEIEKIKKAAKDYTKDSIWISLTKWLGSGFSGIIATTLAIVLAFGAMSIFSSEEKKNELIQQTLEKLVQLYSTPPIS